MEAKIVISVGFILCLSFGGSLSSATVPWKDCGSKESKISEVKLNVNCSSRICRLPEGTNIDVEVMFTPDLTVTNITAVVHGIIAGLPVRFPIPQPDACHKSGLVCPLKPEKMITYKAVIAVKKSYPKIKLDVKWELQDKSGKDVFCFILPAELVSE